MNECGDIGYLKGGAISESDIVSSRISNSNLVGCVIESAHMTNLSSIDELSAQRIADAIAALPTEKLMPLATAIAKAMSSKQAEAVPEKSTADTLPTVVFGEREALLGVPVIWLDYYGYAVPAYSKPV